MTTQIDVLNAQIADAQAEITANTTNLAQKISTLTTQSNLQVAKLNKNITDWQNQITALQAAQDSGS